MKVYLIDMFILDTLHYGCYVHAYLTLEIMSHTTHPRLVPQNTQVGLYLSLRANSTDK